MKKKILILSIIICILISIFSFSMSADTDKNIELNVPNQISIEEGTKKVEVVMSLGEFTGIEDNIVLGYQGDLEYDKTMFTSATIEGLNEWHNDASTVLLGMSDVAKSNTDIAKITLTLKDGLVKGNTGKIKINNFILSGGEDDERFEFTKEITVTIKEKTVEQQHNTPTTLVPSTTPGTTTTPTPVSTSTTETKEEPKKTTNSTKQNLVEINTKKVDTTTTNKTIPKTGQKDISKIFIIVVLLIGIFSFIRYKNITIK